MRRDRLAVESVDEAAADVVADVPSATARSRDRARRAPSRSGARVRRRGPPTGAGGDGDLLEEVTMPSPSTRRRHGFDEGGGHPLLLARLRFDSRERHRFTHVPPRDANGECRDTPTR